jgi:hypothetical protein
MKDATEVMQLELYNILKTSGKPLKVLIHMSPEINNVKLKLDNIKLTDMLNSEDVHKSNIKFKRILWLSELMPPTGKHMPLVFSITVLPTLTTQSSWLDPAIKLGLLKIHGALHGEKKDIFDSLKETLVESAKVHHSQFDFIISYSN